MGVGTLEVLANASITTALRIRTRTTQITMGGVTLPAPSSSPITGSGRNEYEARYDAMRQLQDLVTQAAAQNPPAGTISTSQTDQGYPTTYRCTNATISEQPSNPQIPMLQWGPRVDVSPGQVTITLRASFDTGTITITEEYTWGP